MSEPWVAVSFMTDTLSGARLARKGPEPGMKDVMTKLRLAPVQRVQRVQRVPAVALALGPVVVATLIAIIPAAQGHSLLVVPPPRDQQDGYKDPPRAPPGTGAPCGVRRMVPPQPQTVYGPGLPLHVTWTETVDHPGCFVVDFALADDANFQVLGVKSHAAPVGATPRSWSLDVVLPATASPAGTLRLRQLMLAADLPDAACPPASIPAGATYYSCANVLLGRSGGQPGAGGATGSGATSGGQAGASGGGGTTGTGAASGTDGAAGGCNLGGPSMRPTGFVAAILIALALGRSRTRKKRQP